MALAAPNGEGATTRMAPARTASALVRAARFDEALGEALARRGPRSRAALCDVSNAVALRVLNEYGAIFLASAEVLPPPVCIFAGEEEVDAFQREARGVARQLGGATIELQPAAMRALVAAREEALAENLDITPRDGREAARRSYADTLRLWNSRLLPALAYWRGLGRVTTEEAERLKSLTVREQVGAVLEFEQRGLFFGKSLSRSILHSVAAPGSSQHLSLLAFDVNEYGNARVRAILARHGWFRTVLNDAPHFTYLGLPERDLPARGLKKLRTRDGGYWVPNA